MSYKTPPTARCQLSDSTTQIITSTTVAYPVFFDTNDDIKGITHDVTGATVTITNASPGVVTWTGHTLVVGDGVKFTTDGALPTGLVAGTAYFVSSVASNTFQVSAVPGGTAVNTSSAGSGTHTAKSTNRLVLRSTGVGLVSISIIAEGGLNDHVDVWPRLDGTDIARSNTIIQIAKASAETLIAVPFIVSTSTTGQKLELWWRGETTGCSLFATAAGAAPTRPACPSAIITIVKVSK